MGVFCPSTGAQKGLRLQGKLLQQETKGRTEPLDFSGTSLGFSPRPRHHDLFSFPFLLSFLSFLSFPFVAVARGQCICAFRVSHTHLGPRNPPSAHRQLQLSSMAAQTPPRGLRLRSCVSPSDLPRLGAPRARRSPAGCTSPPAENPPHPPARCNADTPKPSQQLQGTTGCSSAAGAPAWPGAEPTGSAY